MKFCLLSRLIKVQQFEKDFWAKSFTSLMAVSNSYTEFLHLAGALMKHFLGGIAFF